jgi:hypothetical protein
LVKVAPKGTVAAVGVAKVNVGVGVAVVVNVPTLV